jgi:hypothetical protein
MNLAGQCVVGYCRKAGSNHTKTILSLVRGWVVVGVVLGSGVAWAVGESKIVAPNGCVFNIQQLFGAGTVFKTDGKCANGYATGDWIFGLTFPDDNPSVIARTFIDGNSYGVHMYLGTMRGGIFVTEPSFNGHYFIDSFAGKDGDLLPLIEMYQKIDRAAKIAQDKRLPVPNIQKYKNLVMSWRKDRNAFVEQWMAPMTNSENSPSDNKSTTRDDPKVFGRNARGG